MDQSLTPLKRIGNVPKQIPLPNNYFLQCELIFFRRKMKKIQKYN